MSLLFANSKFSLFISYLGQGLKGNQFSSHRKTNYSKHARIDTEFSENEGEESGILEKQDFENKENMNESNYESNYFNEDTQYEEMAKLKGLEFKNKFIEGNYHEANYHRRNYDNEVPNPLFLQKIHQTEEDEENIEIMDNDFELNNMWNFNEDKINLAEMINSKVIFF